MKDNLIYEEQHALTGYILVCNQEELGEVHGMYQREEHDVLVVVNCYDGSLKDRYTVLPAIHVDTNQNAKVVAYQLDCSFIKEAHSFPISQIKNDIDTVYDFATKQFGEEAKWKESNVFVPVNHREGYGDNLGSYQVTDGEPDDNIGLGEVMDFDKMKGNK